LEAPAVVVSELSTTSPPVAQQPETVEPVGVFNGKLAPDTVTLEVELTLTEKTQPFPAPAVQPVLLLEIVASGAFTLKKRWSVPTVVVVVVAVHALAPLVLQNSVTGDGQG